MNISSPFRRHWNLCSCVLAAVLAGSLGPGCSPNLPRTPTVPTDEGSFQRADLSQPGMDDDAFAALQLYPGDVVTLRLISTDTEEYEGLVVDERGVIHIPLAGDVPVGGLDLTEAEQRVEQSIRQYDRTSRVSLVVSEPNGHQASVLGAVASPGRFPVSPGMRLADLLASAGGAAVSEEEGFSMPSGDLGGARLVRNGQALPVSLEIALTGDPRHNVRVRPGDTLFVPADLSRLVSVLGQVGSPRIMAFRPGMRLTHALSLAGGVTRDGNWGDVRVIRGDAAQPMVYTTSVAAIVDGDAHDVVLAPGDIVYVASTGAADLRDVMASISLLVSIPITAASVTVPALILRP